MLTNEQLKYLAESGYWKQAKIHLVHFVEQIDRVSEPLIVDGITITPKDAYLGKLLAVKTITEFIDSVDSFGNKEERSRDLRDSME